MFFVCYFQVHRRLHGDNIPVLPTLENLDNISQHYLEINCGENEPLPPFSDDDDGNDNDMYAMDDTHDGDDEPVECLEPQVSIAESTVAEKKETEVS